VIKGIELSKRNKYYQVLASADIGFHQGFSNYNLSTIIEISVVCCLARSAICPSFRLINSTMFYYI
jgi:hypothetical protein